MMKRALNGCGGANGMIRRCDRAPIERLGGDMLASIMQMMNTVEAMRDFSRVSKTFNDASRIIISNRTVNLLLYPNWFDTMVAYDPMTALMWSPSDANKLLPAPPAAAFKTTNQQFFTFQRRVYFAAARNVWRLSGAMSRHHWVADIEMTVALNTPGSEGVIAIDANNKLVMLRDAVAIYRGVPSAVISHVPSMQLSANGKLETIPPMITPRAFFLTGVVNRGGRDIILAAAGVSRDRNRVPIRTVEYLDRGAWHPIPPPPTVYYRPQYSNCFSSCSSDEDSIPLPYPIQSYVQCATVHQNRFIVGVGESRFAKGFVLNLREDPSSSFLSASWEPLPDAYDCGLPIIRSRERVGDMIALGDHLCVLDLATANIGGYIPHVYDARNGGFMKQIEDANLHNLLSSLYAIASIPISYM